MKVGIHLGGSKSGHEVRGIGVHTSELMRALTALEHKDIKISEYNPKEKYDLVHFTQFKPFNFSFSFKKPAPKVVLTIHDLIPLIYPQHYPAGIKGSLVFFIQKHLIKKNVDAIITISETSKKDICRFLGVDPAKVYVIYLAPKKIYTPITNHQSLITVQKKYSLPDSFVLYVGDVNYNKNIPNLLKACKMVGIKLVMVGKQAKEIKEGRIDLSHPELFHLKGVDWGNTLTLGFIPDRDLAAIYNLATVYVEPSFYEGFGLPVLEALACGCPVVAAKTQALVEIAEGAVTFVNPGSLEDMVRGIKNPFKRVANLPRQYSWTKTAMRTLEVYEKI